MANEDESAKTRSVYKAHHESDIDGHGDEGAGYDYGVFVSELEQAGWVFRGGRYDDDEQPEDQTLKVYGIEVLSDKDHNWGEWERDEWAELYASRESAQKEVDRRIAEKSKDRAKGIKWGFEHKHKEWQKQQLLYEHGLVDLCSDEPVLPTDEELANMRLSESEAGVRVCEIEVQP